jgi:ABC-2 type transport system permease protein
MNGFQALYRRELAAYFSTPLAYLFLIIFLVLSGAFGFWLGGFYERNQADLSPFFMFHPWLYLMLVPAVSMRLWAEERHTGSIELLLTLPISTATAVLAKFFAAWTFIGLALALTFPTWLTVNYLGHPDNGAILASYLGSFILAGSYLAIGSALSANTRSQVIAFISSVTVCLLLLLAGQPLVLDACRAWLPNPLVDAISAISLLSHFQAIQRGVLDLRDLIYFALTMGTWLWATTVVIDHQQAD